jgi:hypothetical protein
MYVFVRDLYVCMHIHFLRYTYARVCTYQQHAHDVCMICMFRINRHLETYFQVHIAYTCQVMGIGGGIPGLNSGMGAPQQYQNTGGGAGGGMPPLGRLGKRLS